MSEDVKDRKYKLGIWVYKVYFVINMNDNGKKKRIMIYLEFLRYNFLFVWSLFNKVRI